MDRARRVRVARVALFMVCAAPLVGLIGGFATDQLGANPVETITHVTGESALRLTRSPPPRPAPLVSIGPF